MDLFFFCEKDDLNSYQSADSLHLLYIVISFIEFARWFITRSCRKKKLVAINVIIVIYTRSCLSQSVI